jgi:hypothetical protein
VSLTVEGNLGPQTAFTGSSRALARGHLASVLGFTPPAELVNELGPAIARELSRMPEVEIPARDQWGNWEFPFGESNLRGELYRPWLDLPVIERRRALVAERSGLRAEPPWPEDRPFALCLTHDVDLVSLDPPPRDSLRQLARDARLLAGGGDSGPAGLALRNVTRALFRLATLKGLGTPAHRSYDEWLALEGRHGFHSTFFVFPEHVPEPHVYDCLYGYDDVIPYDHRRLPVREVLREIARAGWEVGLHGSYRSALRAGLLADQKRQVEQALGGPVTSTRQHWLHWDARITPGLQAGAGLLADSTQGFNRNIGFRAGTAFPYPCWDHESGETLPVLEVPQHVMDGALFTTNALECDEALAIRHGLHLMDQVQAVGGCLTLSWHPNTIVDPTYWAVYQALLAEAAHRNAWGCSVGELRTWWTARTRRILGEPPQA